MQIINRIITITILVFLIQNVSSQTNIIGKSIQSLILRDSNDKNVAIPNVGKQVIIIFYTDPDEKDVNDPLSNAIKAKKYPKDKYTAVGIGNCADTWLPNSAIRMGTRQKEKQYPGSVILLDIDRVLSKAWNLNDCNDKGVFIIIGKDQKIKYINYVKSQEESTAIITIVLKTIEEELLK
jgi:predicted transcriptional regulator